LVLNKLKKIFPDQHLLLNTINNVNEISSDASNRVYYRLHSNQKTYIFMDSSKEKESFKNFLKIAKILKKKQINVPDIFCFNKEEGWAIISDLGSNCFVDIINNDNSNKIIKKLIDFLILMQTNVKSSLISTYSNEILETELRLFDQWYLKKHLKIKLNANNLETLYNLYEKIISNMINQSKVFTHRDFMLRNLMSNDLKIGLIDFQDAKIGPYTYDFVSLLKDTNFSWNEKKINQYISYYFEKKDPLLPIESKENLISDFYHTAIHRHLKVLGIFARLYYRDNKKKYLINEESRFRNYLKNSILILDEFKPILALMS
jgi:aminoglycoside/choline kinase family phosphotransferase